MVIVLSIDIQKIITLLQLQKSNKIRSLKYFLFMREEKNIFFYIYSKKPLA